MRPVLVLRPEPGAAATVARAHAMGLEVRRYPLFIAEPIGWTMPAGAFDALLLTSANAVRHAGPLPKLPAYAVGEATAAAAREAGLSVAGVGSGGIDALLAGLPASLRLLHPSGEERIAPRGPAQRIVSVAVYRMAEQALPPAALIEGSVALVHSPAAGRRLAVIAADRSAVRLAAISRAAADACGPGWERCAAAERPDDRALLSLAARLCDRDGS